MLPHFLGCELLLTLNSGWDTQHVCWHYQNMELICYSKWTHVATTDCQTPTLATCIECSIKCLATCHGNSNFFQTVGFSQEMDMPETLGNSSEILAWRSRHVHLARPHEAELGATQKSRAIPGSHDGILLVLKTRPFAHISKPRDHTADITKHVFLTLAELALQSWLKH